MIDNESFEVEMNEEDIFRSISFDKFLQTKNEHEEYRKLDLNNFKNLSVQQIGSTNIHLFNEMFLYCKRVKDLELFPILVSISEHFIEGSKLKTLLNDSVIQILSEELSISESTFDEFFK